MIIRRFLIMWACVAAIWWSPNTLAETCICTKKESIEAEGLVTAKSWGELHQQFKRYAHCDDGAIGEGFSESVSILLAEQWGDIGQLGAILKSDPSFHKFVIRHINDTVSIDRLGRVAKNAGKRCPRYLKKLCRDIEAATSQKK